MLNIENNKITIGAIQKAIIRGLGQLADPARAEAAQRFFPEKISCYGVKAADVRILAREVFLKVNDSWNIGQALKLTEALLSFPELESKLCGLIILGHFKSELKPAHLIKFKSWLKKGYLNNWALIDTFSLEVIYPLIIRNVEAIKIINGWSREPNIFIRRTALVAMVKMARRRECLATIFQMVKAAIEVEKMDDLVAKAGGWLLREAGKIEPARLEKFLVENGQKLPRITIRYALEKFPDSRRKYLLEKTRTT